MLVRYRPETTLSGKLPAGTSLLLVAQRCPELARGSTRAGKGTAGALKPGQRHVLELRPLQSRASLVDPYASRQPELGPRFEAVRTDAAPEPPRVAVVVSGGAGVQQRLEFEAEEVSVGRAADSDILLNHRDVGLQHLRLQWNGSAVEVVPLGTGRLTRINGQRAHAAQAVTHRDLIEVGPYKLHVSVFAPEEESTLAAKP